MVRLFNCGVAVVDAKGLICSELGNCFSHWLTGELAGLVTQLGSLSDQLKSFRPLTGRVAVLRIGR